MKGIHCRCCENEVFVDTHTFTPLPDLVMRRPGGELHDEIRVTLSPADRAQLVAALLAVTFEPGPHVTVAQLSAPTLFDGLINAMCPGCGAADRFLGGFVDDRNFTGDFAGGRYQVICTNGHLSKEPSK